MKATGRGVIERQALVDIFRHSSDGCPTKHLEGASRGDYHDTRQARPPLGRHSLDRRCRHLLTLAPCSTLYSKTLSRIAALVPDGSLPGESMSTLLHATAQVLLLQVLYEQAAAFASVTTLAKGSVLSLGKVGGGQRARDLWVRMSDPSSQDVAEGGRPRRKPPVSVLRRPWDVEVNLHGERRFITVQPGDSILEAVSGASKKFFSLLSSDTHGQLMARGPGCYFHAGSAEDRSHWRHGRGRVGERNARCRG